MNKVDLIILGIILVFMLIGYKKGLIKVILNLIQYIIVLGLSVFFAPAFSKFLIENFNLDIKILNLVTNNIGLFTDGVTIISNEILKNIVGRIINILAIVILFVALKIVFGIILMILNKVANLPILSVVNRVGGLLLGALEGVLIVYIFTLIINWFPISTENMVINSINDSFMVSTISYLVPEVATEVINMVQLSE